MRTNCQQQNSFVDKIIDSCYRTDSMVTTADISSETGLGQRTIQKRIVRLGLQCKYAGPVTLLTDLQAEKVKAMSSRPGPKVKSNNHKGKK